MYKSRIYQVRFLRILKLSHILFMVLLAGCRGEQRSFTRDDSLKVQSDVRQLFDQYYKAVAKDGLTAEFQYLDHSPDFFWVPPGYTNPISYDSVASVLTLNAPRFVSVENELDTLRIIPLTPMLATYNAKLRSVVKDTSGNISSVQLIETGLVIKRGDGWKLLSGQTSLAN